MLQVSARTGKLRQSDSVRTIVAYVGAEQRASGVVKQCMNSVVDRMNCEARTIGE